jgi:hypothetical protein
MPEISGLASIEEEHAELEAAIEALGRSSRLAQLLHYIGDKHCAGESGLLSEYTIATEVFGRSKTTFDAGEDAIVRVEAHRLRKRLKEYYAGPGKDHAIQLSIPTGTYVPSFTHRPIEQPAASPETLHNSAQLVAAQAPAPPTEPIPQSPTSPGNPRRTWILALLAAVLVAAVVAGLYFFRSGASATTTQRGSAPTTLHEQAPPAIPTGPAVRILAGYTGEPQIDSTGALWYSDRYESGGGPWRRPEGPIARTSDPFLFNYWRNGDSSYDVPLRPSLYDLHLYFITVNPSGNGISTFNVKINGKLVLQGFDINTDALGADIADERIFRDISPAADGKLHLAFTSERGAPQINAIEVVPGLPHRTLPIRLVMQRTSYTDHEGRFWHADDHFMDGQLSDQPQEISGSSDPNLLSTERYGHFTYASPVDTRDRYSPILHFVEFYFGPNAAGGGGVGSRLFKVMCNGQTLLDYFDIYKDAGSLHVLTKTFYHLKPSAQGKLNITFEPIVNNATISGIEVLDESE